MAKKSLVIKANRKPKFAVRGYTRCRRCGRARAYLPRLRDVPYLCSRAGAAGRAPRRQEGSVVR